MWGLGFAGFGVLIRDAETWKIEEDEAADLSARFAAASESFQSDRTSKLVQWIKKHEAELYFLAGLLTLAGPRLYHTLTVKRAAKVANLQTKTETRPVGLGPRLVVDHERASAPAAPTAASSGTEVPPESAPVSSQFTGTADNGRAPIGYEARPFTRADFAAFDTSAE